LHNLGGSPSIQLIDTIYLLAKYLGRDVLLEMLPMQAGDVEKTEAVPSLQGWSPKVSIEEGLGRFAGWYKGYAQ